MVSVGELIFEQVQQQHRQFISDSKGKQFLRAHRESSLSLSLTLSWRGDLSLSNKGAVSISFSQKETGRSLFLCSLSVPKKETVLSLSQRPAPVLETQRDSAQPNLGSSDLGSAACWLSLRDPQKHWIIGFLNEKIIFIRFYWIFEGKL